jgi:integrase/recombinase XerD
MINAERKNILNKVYEYDRTIEREIEKLKKRNTKNSLKVIEYYESYLKTSNLAPATQVKWFTKTAPMAEWFTKEFNKCTRKDVEKVVEENINKNNNINQESRKQEKIALKKLFRWIKKCEEDEYPPEVSWIKTPRNKGRKRIDPEDLLDDNDIELMIKAADNPRDRAFLILMGESGCRIGEALTLQVGSINFDERGAFFNVEGKTGVRRVRTINATPYLHDWLAIHPDKDNPESPLWVNIGTTKHISKKFDKGEIKKGKDYNDHWNYALSYAAARKILVNLGRKAKIKKPINPHNFRHSRATALGAGGLNQSIMNEIMGWKQGSQMAGVYIHLSGKQTDDALLPAIYGIKVQKEERGQSQMFPIKCINCGELNAHNVKRCKKCNNIIGVITKSDIEQNKDVIDMSKYIGNVIAQKEDLKKQLYEEVKKDIMKEIEERIKKK